MCVCVDGLSLLLKGCSLWIKEGFIVDKKIRETALRANLGSRLIVTLLITDRIYRMLCYLSWDSV